MMIPIPNIKTLITTASGVAGGITKAFFSNITIISITLYGIGEVAFYAAISAVTAYSIKTGIDQLKKIVRKKR